MLWLAVSCVASSDSGPSPVAGSELRIAPISIPADGASQAVLDLWLRDGAGNPLPHTIVEFSTPSEVTLEPAVATTDAAGHVQIVAYGVVPASVSISVAARIQDRTVITPATARLEVTPMAPSQSDRISVAVNPLLGSVDVAVQRTVRVAVTNAAGAPVMQQPVRLSSNRPGDTFAEASGVTDAAGHFSTTLLSQQSGVATISASVPPLGQAQTTASFLPGAPDGAHTYFLIQQGTTVVADGVTANPAEVFVGDQFGNPVPYAPVSVAAVSGNAALVPPAGSADAHGVFHTTLTTAAVAQTSVTIQSGTAISQHGIAGSVGPASPNTSALTLSPNILIADGVAAAAGSFQVLDAAGHARVGEVVVFSCNGPNATLTPSSTTTDANGYAQTQLRATTSGSTVLVAQSANVMLQAPVTFVPGPISATLSSLSVAGGPVVANGTAPLGVSVQLADAFGNAAAQQMVSVSTFDSNDSLSPSSGQSDASGLWASSWTSTHAGTRTLTAMSGNVTLFAQGSFVPGPLDATQSRLSTAANSVVAGDVGTQLTFFAADGFGNPIANQQVTLTAPEGVTLTAATLSTGAEGLASTQVQASIAQAAALGAAAGNFTWTTYLTVYAGAPNAALSSLNLSGAPPVTIGGVLSPSAAAADGVGQLLALAQLRDAFGNACPNTPVAFAVTGNSVSFGPLGALTDGNGTATAVGNTTLAQNVTVTAQAPSVALSAQASFVALVAAMSQSSLAVSPNALSVDNTNGIVLQATFKDQFNNPLIGMPVTLAATGTTNVFGNLGAATDANGQFVSGWQSTQAAVKTLSVTAGNLTLTASANFAVGSPNAMQSSFYNYNANVLLGAAGAVTVRIADRFGNGVPNQTVTLVDYNGLTVSPATRVTGAAGTTSSAFTVTYAQRGDAALLATSPNVALYQAIKVSTFALSGLRSLPTGLIDDIVVTARNINGTTNTGYRGTIVFSSTDANALLPSAYTFTAADNGVHAFAGQITFYTPGNQVISVADTGNLTTMYGNANTAVLYPTGATVRIHLSPSLVANCVHAVGPSAAAGTPLINSVCSNHYDDQFVFASDATLRTLNQCVEPQGGVLTPNQPVVLMPCQAKMTQRWTRQGGPTQSLADPNYCIDFLGAASGDVVRVQRCTSLAASTTFYELFTPFAQLFATGAGFPFATGGQSSSGQVGSRSIRYTPWRLTLAGEMIALGGSNYSCLDTNTNPPSVGGYTYIAPCSGSATQKWQVTGRQYRTLANPNLCLKIDSTTGLLMLDVCGSAQTQNFILYPGAGMVRLRAPNAGVNPMMCLQAGQVPVGQNTQLGVAACSNSVAQVFSNFAQTNNSGGWSLTLPLLGNVGQAFSVDPMTTSATGPFAPVLTPYVATFPSSTDQTMHPSVMPLPGMYAPPFVGEMFYYFRGFTYSESGKYPTALLDYSAATASGNVLVAGQSLDPNQFARTLQQQLLIAPAFLGISPQMRPDLCMTFGNANSSVYQTLSYQSCVGSENQRFLYVFNYGGSTSTGPIQAAGLCMDVNRNIAASQNNLLLAPCSNSVNTTQGWVNPHLGTLRNYNGLCVDGNGVTAGALVNAVPCATATNTNLVLTP